MARFDATPSPALHGVQKGFSTTVSAVPRRAGRLQFFFSDLVILLFYLRYMPKNCDSIYLILLQMDVGWMNGDMWMWDEDLFNISARIKPMH